jgi:hypothetical protein
VHAHALAQLPNRVPSSVRSHIRDFLKAQGYPKGANPYLPADISDDEDESLSDDDDVEEKVGAPRRGDGLLLLIPKQRNHTPEEVPYEVSNTIVLNHKANHPGAPAVPLPLRNCYVYSAGVWIDGIEFKCKPGLLQKRMGLGETCSSLVQYQTSVHAPPRWGDVYAFYDCVHLGEKVLVAKISRLQRVAPAVLGGPSHPVVRIPNRAPKTTALEYVMAHCITHMGALMAQNTRTRQRDEYFLTVHVISQESRTYMCV